MKKLVILSVVLAWVAVFGLLWTNLNEKPQPTASPASSGVNLNMQDYNGLN